jgi:hypothetical protein
MRGFLKRILGISKPAENNVIAPESAASSSPAPCEIIRTPGSKCLEVYYSLIDKQQLYPVILGDQHEYERLMENFEDSSDSFESIIQAAELIDPKKWFVEQASKDEDLYQVDIGDWPLDPEVMELSAHLDTLSRKPKSEVLIGLLPVKESWEVPAFLKLGGWNDCPFAQEHAAIYRYWASKWGAKVTCVTDDVVEFTVTKQPETREDALQLAREQFIFCTDLVFQGTQTLSNLAAALKVSKTWYFWWD